LTNLSRRWLAVLLLSAALVTAFACSDDDDGDTQDGAGGAESAFCDDLSEVKSSVDDLKGIDSSSTGDDVKQAVNEVKTSLDELQGSARDVAEEQVGALRSAIAGLESVIQNISGDQTLGAIGAAIQAGVSGVQQAVDQLGVRGSCP
jgi:saccharopine dehydrogenase-like NADP-dependent oxidoreductase